MKLRQSVMNYKRLPDQATVEAQQIVSCHYNSIACAITTRSQRCHVVIALCIKRFPSNQKMVDAHCATIPHLHGYTDRIRMSCLESLSAGNFKTYQCREFLA